VKQVIFQLFNFIIIFLSLSSYNSAIIIDTDSGLPEPRNNKIILRNGHCSITCVDLIKEEVIWEFKPFHSNISSVYKEDSIAYITSGLNNLDILNINTGEKILNIELPVNLTLDFIPKFPMIYFKGTDSIVYAYNLISKQIKWKYQIKGRNEHFSFLNDNLSYWPGDSILYCLNVKNGNLIWKYAANGKINSNPDISNDMIIFGCDDGNIYILNRNNGKFIKNVQIKRARATQSYIFEDKLIYEKMPGLINVENINTGDLVWTFEKYCGIAPYVSSFDSSIFLVSGYRIYWFNIQNGELRHEFRIDNKYAPVGTPLFKMHNLYTITRNGSLLRISLDNKKQKIIYRNDDYSMKQNTDEAIINLEIFKNYTDYPENLKKAGIEGKVVVDVWVGIDGEKLRYDIQSSDNDLLNQAAILAIEKTQIKPKKVCDNPSPSWVTVPITFRLK
jgi:TonB family protein